MNDNQKESGSSLFDYEFSNKVEIEQIKNNEMSSIYTKILDSKFLIPNYKGYVLSSNSSSDF